MDEFYDSEPWDTQGSDGHMLLDAVSNIQERPGALLNLHLSSIHTTLENLHRSQLMLEKRLRAMEELLEWRAGAWSVGLAVALCGALATVAAKRLEGWPWKRPG
jgi:hypothetical protein